MSDAGNLETVDVVRQELRLFLSLADRIGIDGDRQRRFLRMSQGEWQQLLGLQSQGAADQSCAAFAGAPSRLSHQSPGSRSARGMCVDCGGLAAS